MWRSRIIFRKKRKKNPDKKYLRYKEAARVLVKNRIAYYNLVYQFKVGRVSIKNTKSRWGSCSKKGNLNFNYRVVLLPPIMADYVIVHELCHLGEFNHSKNFWGLVGKTIPEYKRIKLLMRKIHV